MSLRLTALISTLALAGAFANAAYAADEAGKPTKSSLAPAGEGPGAEASAPSKTSDRSRASVKSSTKAANMAGGLAPAGNLSAPVSDLTRNVDADRAMAPKSSTKSRSAVKADTKADRAAGTLQPAGEAAQPANDPPKK